MSILFMTNDLMFFSRVSMAARAKEKSIVMCGSAESLIEKVTDSDAELVILDLSAAGLEVGEVVAQLRSVAKQVKIIAFAPHVHEARLAAAVDAACDEVFTRGQFSQRLDELLTEHLSNED